MASTRPGPAQSKGKPPTRSAGKGKAPAPVKRGPAAGVRAAAPGSQPRLAAAKGLPGWRGARTLLGEALAAGDSAVLVEARDQLVTLRRRSDAGWQPPSPLVGDDAAAVFAALARLAPQGAGQDDAGFVVKAGKLPRRTCRVETRKGVKGEQVLLLVGPELPRREPPRFGRLFAAALGRLVPPFLRRTPAEPERDPTLPEVDLEATGPDAAARREAVVEADGYVPACDLVAAAVRDRANTIVIEGGPQGVTVQFDVDGVRGPAPGIEAAEVAAVAAVLRTVAGLDLKARGPVSGKVTAMVQGKSWPCTVTARRGTSGERVELAIDHGRPKFKALADTGVPESVVAGLQELLKLDSGLILLCGPRRSGLSTLFDGVINSADRLLRDFVLLEDGADPRPELPNVKPFRWGTGGVKPAAALEAALREYPNVLATCDLEDAELARQLVTQAAEGRLVIAAIRAADAADGIARLLALGVDRRTLARMLTGAAGVRLVRKLCPKCRHEYFPPVDALARLKLDPDRAITLFRAPEAGCAVCTRTGYLGRAAVAELVPGTALRAGIEGQADAKALRELAAKAGVATVQRDALVQATRGVTSVEEVQRVFQKA